MDSAILSNLVLSLLLKKIVVPTDWTGQNNVIKLMLTDDMTGLVNSLTQFAVSSAKVDFSIETSSERLNDLFKRWLDTLNMDLSATAPIGIKALAEEYFKERWMGSGFCVLKIAKWEKIEGSELILPTKMYIVDGSSVRAEDVDEKDENLKLDSYKYYIGTNFSPKYEIKNSSSVIHRPYCRWYDKYPVPYLIKQGVYHNYKIIESLKTRQTEILDQIIPYLLLIKKGTENLAISNTKTYSDSELTNVIEQMQELMTDLKSTNLSDKTIKSPIRATNFDEEIKHLIPDVGTMFKAELFEEAERNILSGLGFIDVVQGVSSTRREAVLNPKAFVQEVNSGVEGFKEILSHLLVLIKLQNDSHIKYNSSDFYICSSPVKAFQSEEFLTNVRSLYDRGCLSKKTYAELVGQVDFETEIYRREKESKSGVDYIMYPQLTQNNEDKGIDIQGKNPNSENPDDIPDDKKGIEKQNYNMSSYDEDIIEDDIVNSLEEEIELSALKKKVRVTEQYLRYRQVEPNKFDEKSFRTVTLSPSKGIKSIVGKIKGTKTTTIQSYLFNKSRWTDKTAKVWLDEHSSAFVSTIEKYDIVQAPYTQLTELPDYIKKLDIEKQRAWIKIFNNAYRTKLAQTGDNKQAEKYAFRVANSVIKRVKSNLGFWEQLKDRFTKK